MEYCQLMKYAEEAKEKSYSPYSRFRVGAALLCKNGKVFTGCNIENASYGLTNCAERTAIYKAISEGITEFEAIAVSGDGEDLLSPCGACRQVLCEFGREIVVIMSDGSKNLLIKKAEELLPYSFGPEDLEEVNKK